VKKEECEQAIRSLCHKWREASGLSATPPGELSFADFIAWVRQGYSQYLSFHTTTSVEYDAELWFDQEFQQSWRR
jgi:hypothetical protein